jgi:hypothetical protein
MGTVKATETGEAEGAERGRKATQFTPETAREMASRSAASRRAKAEAREQNAEADARTFRQRLGVSLSKLGQKDLDGVVTALAKAGNANALARLADQAFGKPQVAEADAPTDADLAGLSREQRATLRAMLEGADPDAELESMGNDAQNEQP